MKKASYLFNLLAVGIVLISAVIYFNFEHTKNEIYSINNSANREYPKAPIKCTTCKKFYYSTGSL